MFHKYFLYFNKLFKNILIFNKFLNKNKKLINIKYNIYKNYLINDDEKKLLIQFLKIKNFKNKLNKMLLNLLIYNNNFVKKKIKQPEIILLKYIFNIYKKNIINFKLKKNYLIERKILISHYQILIYLKLQLKINFNLIKKFSLHLWLFFYNILMISFIKIEQPIFIKYLLKNNYITFIKILINFININEINNNKFIINYNNIYKFNNVKLETKILKNIFKTINIIHKINRFYIIFQFKLVKIISPHIIFISNLYLIKSYISIIFNYYFNKNKKKINIITYINIFKNLDPFLIKNLNICINIKKIYFNEQKNKFFNVFYTKRLYLKIKNKILDFKNIKILSFINEIFLINIINKKFFVNDNIIIICFYKQKLNFQSNIILYKFYKNIFYKIGIFFFNKNILSEYIYFNKRSKNFIINNIKKFYKYYFEINLKIKKLILFIYIINCSYKLTYNFIYKKQFNKINKKNEKKKVNFYKFIKNDLYLIYELLKFKYYFINIYQYTNIIKIDKIIFKFNFKNIFSSPKIWYLYKFYKNNNNKTIILKKILKNIKNKFILNNKVILYEILNIFINLELDIQTINFNIFNKKKTIKIYNESIFSNILLEIFKYLLNFLIYNFIKFYKIINKLL